MDATTMARLICDSLVVRSVRHPRRCPLEYGVGIDLDNLNLVGAGRDEQVMGRAIHEGDRRLTAVVHWRRSCISRRPGCREDRTVDAGPSSGGVRRAVTIESDELHDSLRLRDTPHDVEASRREHVQTV